MKYLIEDIQAAADAQGVTIKILENEVAGEIFNNLRQKFSANLMSTRPLWELLEDKHALQDSKAILRLSPIPEKNDIFLFFGDEERPFGALFANYADLTKVLWESTGFIFYVTNSNLDYILSYNDHDILIGSGDCDRIWEIVKDDVGV